MNFINLEMQVYNLQRLRLYLIVKTINIENVILAL